MLGVKLYTWQIKFLTDIQKAIDGGYWTREFIGMTSRQIGKSTSVAIISLWAAVFNKVPTKTQGNYTHIGVVSASDKQAKKLLREVKNYMRMGDAFMNLQYEGQFGKKFFSNLLSDEEPNNTDTVTFKNYDEEKHGEFLLKNSLRGSVINSFPPTPVVLGESFTMLIIDEAGKSDKVTDEFFDDYVSPTAVAHNAIRIYTSTPWVLSGFFYRLVDPEDTKSDHPYKRYMFTDSAIREENENQYNVIQAEKKAKIIDGRKDEVERAYHCRFVKGDTTYFNPENVKLIFDDGYEMLESFKTECDMGIDFGGKASSNTVITISYLDSDTIKRIYRRSYPVDEDENLIADCEELMTRFNVQRVVVDDCPGGHYIIRDMEKKGWNITRMEFKRDKIKKYGAFRGKLNRGLVKSYPDEDLKIEMNALEKIEGIRSTQIRHAPGYNDDIIDSFIISCFHFLEEEGGVKYWNWDEVDRNAVNKKKVLSA